MSTQRGSNRASACGSNRTAPYNWPSYDGTSTHNTYQQRPVNGACPRNAGQTAPAHAGQTAQPHPSHVSRRGRFTTVSLHHAVIRRHVHYQGMARAIRASRACGSNRSGSNRTAQMLLTPRGLVIQVRRITAPRQPPRRVNPNGFTCWQQHMSSRCRIGRPGGNTPW